jgi:hypothetical protein
MFRPQQGHHQGGIYKGLEVQQILYVRVLYLYAFVYTFLMMTL